MGQKKISDNVSKVESTNRRFRDGLITRAEAVYELLPLVEETGAESLMPGVCADLQRAMKAWLNDAPKTRAAWRLTRVFQVVQDDLNLSEYEGVRISEPEIDARMKVTAQLQEYFSHDEPE